MFKATDHSTGSEVIILNHRGDDDALEALRQKDRANVLLCPRCNQPVAVKAGAIKVWHFAHKHLADCPLDSESKELVQARAALYQWLRSKFADCVTVEKTLDGSLLPRHIDCWVEREDGSKLAYWIFDRPMRGAEDRQLLQTGLERSGATAVFLFLSSFTRRNGKPRDILNLTTTEREFLRSSQYDFMYPAVLRAYSGSLHYLDPAAETIITFRAMGHIEGPSEYGGTELCTSLANLHVQPSTGEFVHPGERERLIEWNSQQSAIEAKKERERAEDEARRAVAARRATERQQAQDAVWAERLDQIAASESDSMPHATTPPQPSSSPSMSQNREGICEYCGRRTRDWWTLDGRTGLCKCNDCYRSGRA